MTRVQPFGSACKASPSLLIAYWFCLSFMVCGFNQAALAKSVPIELKSAHDSPMLSRYPGSVLVATATSNFTELVVPTGPGQIESSGFVFKKAEKANGHYAGYMYINPANRSALEVFRNFQDGLKAAGFTTLYSCDVAACYKDNIQENYPRLAVDAYVWKPFAAYGDVGQQIHFTATKKTADGKTSYVLIFVGEPRSIWQAPVTVQVVIEQAELQTNQIVVNSASLNRSLVDTGRIALYGLYFDTAKANIKPASKPQLDEIAKLLTANPALNVFIVGHTDNVGGLDSNMMLSLRRAEAVVNALSTTYKINRQRMVPKGVANLAPIAATTSPEGRAKNRRVEIVVR